MNTVLIRTAARAALLSCLCIACSSAKGPREPNPLALISQGDFRQARAIAQKRSPMKPTDRAIVALCLIAEDPAPKSAAKSVTAMAEGVNGIGSAAAALELLDLAFHLQTPVKYDVSVTLTEAALGSVGLGPLAQSGTATISVGAASKSLGIASLERTYLALAGSEAQVDATRLLAIWNASFTLFGGTFAIPDDVQAWTLFHSLGNLSVIMFQTDPTADLSTALLVATISVLEANPSIAIPARCDLSSPFDELKGALAHNRKLLARLESSVANAQGCTRGTYKPVSE